MITYVIYMYLLKTLPAIWQPLPVMSLDHDAAMELALQLQQEENEQYYKDWRAAERQFGKRRRRKQRVASTDPYQSLGLNLMTRFFKNHLNSFHQRTFQSEMWSTTSVYHIVYLSYTIPRGAPYTIVCQSYANRIPTVYHTPMQPVYHRMPPYAIVYRTHMWPVYHRMPPYAIVYRTHIAPYTIVYHHTSPYTTVCQPYTNRMPIVCHPGFILQDGSIYMQT